MTSITAVVAQIIAQPAPVAILDTCNFLDLVRRDTTRQQPRVPAEEIRIASELLQLVTARSQLVPAPVPQGLSKCHLATSPFPLSRSRTNRVIPKSRPCGLINSDVRIEPHARSSRFWFPPREQAVSCVGSMGYNGPQVWMCGRDREAWVPRASRAWPLVGSLVPGAGNDLPWSPTHRVSCAFKSWCRSL